ncbi:MAG: hypothetical protein JRI97_09275 [Deltaproteobacteria bacterium]|nr:hypothetical protein [Deltaproteobacteria bacterium]
MRRLFAVIPVLLALAAACPPGMAMQVLEEDDLSGVAARTGIDVTLRNPAGVNHGLLISNSSFLSWHDDDGLPSFGDPPGSWPNPAFFTLGDFSLYQHDGTFTSTTNRVPLTLSIDSLASGVNIGLPPFNPGWTMEVGDLRVGSTPAQTGAGHSYWKVLLGNMTMGFSDTAGGNLQPGRIVLSGGGNVGEGFSLQLYDEVVAGYLGVHDFDGPGWITVRNLKVNDGDMSYPVDPPGPFELDFTADVSDQYLRLRLEPNAVDTIKIEGDVTLNGNGPSNPWGGNTLLAAALYLEGQMDLLLRNNGGEEAIAFGPGSGGVVTDGFLEIGDADGAASAGAPGVGYCYLNNVWLYGPTGVPTDFGSLAGVFIGNGYSGTEWTFGWCRPVSNQIDCGFDWAMTPIRLPSGAAAPNQTLLRFVGENVTFPELAHWYLPLNGGLELRGGTDAGGNPISFLRLGDRTQTDRFGAVYDFDGYTNPDGATGGWDDNFDEGMGTGYFVLDQFDLGFYGSLALNAVGGAAVLSGSPTMLFYTNAFLNSSIVKDPTKEWGSMELNLPFDTLTLTITAH